MLIKTFDSIRAASGENSENLRALTIPFSTIDKNGFFYNYTVSTAVYSDEPAVILIIDINTANQLDKLKLKFVENEYQLHLKDGEEFTYPIETEKEKQIRELKEQLAALEASQNQGE